MTILESAIRRILIRSVDKTISRVGRNAAYDVLDYKPSFPTLGRLVLNVILLGILVYVVSIFFILLNIEILAYLTPILFVGRIYKPLVTNYIYGQKQEAVTSRDRRFRSGERIEGYRWVEDRDTILDYTPQQITMSRWEGLVKLFIVGLVMVNIHSNVTAHEYRQNDLNEEEVVRLLQPGDTIFAKSEGVEISVKIKETTYRSSPKGKRTVIYENISYETAYSDSLKALGIFIATDTSKADSSSIYTYISILPLNLNGWKFNKRTDSVFEKETIRIDSLFYIKLSDATVSVSKLPPINYKW